jgi:hypothetical protein
MPALGLPDRLDRRLGAKVTVSGLPGVVMHGFGGLPGQSRRIGSRGRGGRVALMLGSRTR